MSQRRELFCRSWSLDSFLTRAEIVAALSVDLVKLRARATTVLWTRTKEQLDQRFQDDLKLVQAALAERNLDETPDGHEQLLQSIAESGEPLVTFKKPDNESELPVLVRTATGLLADAIEFTKSWPQMRTKHNPI